jgi:glycosyltransferase involved in cell wall biosynthesis
MTKIKEVVFISPMYNAKTHLKDLFESLIEQNNPNWRLILIDDMSTDNSFGYACNLLGEESRIQVRKNKEKCWALKNVIKAARKFEDRDDVIIAVIDADDALCNENTVDLLIKAYREETDTVWTGHTWDINSLNISRALPEKINPYQFPWVSSHLKTWRASLLKGISNNNFKDLDCKWFKRGYDQALYLPLLFKSRERAYLDEICYLYRINSKSVDVRIWSEKDQMDTVRLVRARGFVK